MGIYNYSVADTLFSKVQQRVLSLLFGQPDQSFYTNEIIRLTHSGTGAIQRELARLVASSLVTVKQSANQKLYQANQNAHIFPELRSIVLKTFGLADALKESLEPLASRIHVAFIYGSVAKNEDKANSDIDVMIIGEEISYTDLYPLLESVQLKLGRVINPTCYSMEEWIRKHKEGNNFINQVTKQPKIFFIGSEHGLIPSR